MFWAAFNKRFRFLMRQAAVLAAAVLLCQGQACGQGTSTATPLPPPKPRPFELGESPLEVILRARPTAEVGEMPAFVVKSRTPEDQMEFLPIVGVKPEETPTKNLDQLAREKAKLAAAVRKNKARAANDFKVPAYQPKSSRGAPIPSAD